MPSSWTCSRAAAPAASRPSRGAPPGRPSWSKDDGAARVLAENLRRTRLDGAGRVVRRDAVAWLTDPAGAAADGPFDIVLVDPPYADVEALLVALELVGTHTAADGIVVAKHFWRDAPPRVVGLLASARERRFGETALTFYRRRSPAGPGPAPGDEEGSEA